MTNSYLLKTAKFFLYLVPLTVIIVYQGSIFPFIVGKYFFFRTSVELALIFFLIAWARGETSISGNQHGNQRQSALWRQPLIIAVAVFVFIFVLAGFFGYNPAASFWSNYERGEGGLQLLHFLTFFILLALLFKDKESWRRLFIVSLWASALVIFYGTVAALGWPGFIGGNFCTAISGSLGNSAYAGTFFIFSIFYAGYLLTEEKKKTKKWWWIFLIAVFFVFMILAQSRGAFLGFGAGVLAALAYLLFFWPRARVRLILLGVIIILIISGALAIKYRRHINLAPYCPNGNKILDVTFGAESFQTRLMLWNQSILAFKERPVLGWGPENFAPAEEKYFNPKHTAWFDRAHSIFFDYLVFSGGLGLLGFLGIFAVFYWLLIKSQISRPTSSGDEVFGGRANLKSQKENKKNPSITNYQLLITNTLLFGLSVAYLVQGIVLFDVLPIYINIYLLLAFANWKFGSLSQ